MEVGWDAHAGFVSKPLVPKVSVSRPKRAFLLMSEAYTLKDSQPFEDPNIAASESNIH